MGADADYRPVKTLAGRGARPDQFGQALRGVAVDGEGRLYLAGDSEVKVFDSGGELTRRWATSRPGFAVAVDREGRVWVGQEGRAEVYSAGGELLDGWRDGERLGLVTAIGFTAGGVLLADAAARCIRHYDRRGTWLNDVGDRHRKGGFHIPNGMVDFAVDGAGVVHVANPGMHRVERYTATGEPRGYFGRFDGRDPAGFPGCCNPTNVALARHGRVVVTEKAEPRVKVYDAEGRLETVVAGAEDFDPGCKNMDVAVDPWDRIAVADTVRLTLKVFELAARAQEVAA